MEGMAHLGDMTVRLIILLLIATASLAGTGVARADGELIGRLASHPVQPEETFAGIAVAERVGFIELLAANQNIDPWIPEAGTRLILPRAHLMPDAPRRGIVVNLGDLRLYYFPADGSPPRSYPVGIGREGWDTPTGTTRIVRKRPDPVWTPPASIRAERPDLPLRVPPGPDNPLGRFALNLGWPGYVIHGTNRPAGVGRRVSHGCIRLYPQDIAELFAAVAVGTPVTVVDQPVKLGRVADEVYLEAHPSAAQAEALEIAGKAIVGDITDDIRARIRKFAGADASRIDWALVEDAIRRRRGIPARITR